MRCPRWVATGLLAASAVLHTTGTRTQPFSTAGGSSSSSSGGGGGRTLCAIATNEESRSTGQPCHFDYFGTTALSDDGGWFTATCAEDQVESIYFFKPSTCEEGFDVKPIVHGGRFPSGLQLGGPAPSDSAVFLASTNFTPPLYESVQELYMATRQPNCTQETVQVLMSQGEPTPWGTFDEMGRPHYLYLHNGVVFQATVGELNGIYAAWLQPGTDNRLMHNIVNTTMQMPGTNNSTTFHFLDYPALDDDSLVFFGSTSFPTRAGLYYVNITQLHNHPGDAHVRTLVDWTTPLPGSDTSEGAGGGGGVGDGEETFASFTQPAVSGDKVVFLATGTQGTKGIFTVNTATKEVRTLATTASGEYSNLRLAPSVNADGTVGFVASRSDGTAALFVQTDGVCDGRVRQLIAEGEQIDHRKLTYLLTNAYVLNTDGVMVYGVLDDGSFGLYFVELDLTTCPTESNTDAALRLGTAAQDAASATAR